MALDTAAKRFSMMGFNNPIYKIVIPDGSIDQGDRQTYLDLYSGISIGALAIAVGGLVYNWSWDLYED